MKLLFFFNLFKLHIIQLLIVFTIQYVNIII